MLLDGGLADDERLRDPEVGLPLGHRGEHVALARRELVERPAAAAPQRAQE